MDANIIFHVLMNFFAVVVYSASRERRSFFILRVCACALIYGFYGMYFAQMLFSFSNFSYFWRCVDYVINIGLLFAADVVCFKTKPIAALFCTTCGYITQHFTQRLHNLIFYVVLDVSRNNVVDYASHFCLLLVVLVMCYFIQRKYFVQINEQHDISVTWQFILTGCAFSVTVFIEERIFGYILFGPKRLKIGYYIISIVFAVLVMVLEYHLVVVREIRNENLMMQRIMEAERRQYEAEKNVVDAINIKVHDIKHWIADTENTGAKTESLKHAVMLYDSFYKTGNSTLDTVLTAKGLVCDNKHIMFTCVVDGAKFEYMDDGDIYSLFGNLIDNCIEAVQNLPENLREVTVKAEEKHGILSVITENRFVGKTKFVDGIPTTTKSDKRLHGYGIRSVNNVVKKYGGSMQIWADNDVFKVSILFPNRN